MSVVTVVNTYFANNPAANSLVLNVPNGTVNGQLMVVGVSYIESVTITAPTGWTAFTLTSPQPNPWMTGSGSLEQAVYYRYANSSEPTNYTWEFNATAYPSGGIVTLANTATSNPLDVSSQATGSIIAGSLPSSESVTTTEANDYLLVLFGLNDDTTFVTPSGFTELWDQDFNSGQYFGSGAFGMALGAAGATGNIAFGASVSSYGSITLAILAGPDPIGNNANDRVTQLSGEMAWRGSGNNRVTQTSGEMAWHGSSISVQDHTTQDSVELAWQQAVRERVTQDSVELAWNQVVRAHVTQDSVEIAYYNVVVEPNTITSNTFLIGDLVTQIEPFNNGIVQAVIAEITIPGSNTFYELGNLLIVGVNANNPSNTVAQGTLDAITLNTNSNSTILYLSNTTGIFTNGSLVVGLYARSFEIDFIQRMNIGFVSNAYPITGSFDSVDFELITDNITGALGGVSGANSSTIDVVVATGIFNVEDTITGADSGATATILSFSNTKFNVGDHVAQESQVIQLVNIQNATNTGSFQINEIVYQQQKNFRSANAITQNTMVGIIDSCNSTVATMSSEFGPITNNYVLIGANSGCIATINNVKSINTATGVVYSSNSSTIQITQVVGTFLLGHVIYGPNSYANLTLSLPNVYATSTISDAINNLDVIRGTGQLVKTLSNTSLIVDANTEAVGNITYIVMTGQ